MKRPICSILCLLTMLGFGMVFVQGQWHPFKLKPLKGFTTVTAKPVFSFSSYAQGDYQSQCEQYIKENFGFREFCIRLYNQFSYSCFRQINNDNIKEGRNHELYLKMYLDEITGKRLKNDFGSVEKAKTIAQQNLEETLRLIGTLNRHGTEFLFVFAPSKTWVYPENMPKAYRDHIIDFSLEDYYIQLFKENHIPHIDFLSYFKSAKDTVAYPLYPKTGSHWAESTIPMVADSIYRKMEEITGYRLPSVKIMDENITTHYSEPDSELEASMNLLFPLNKPAIPKPVFSLADTLNADKPNLLVVSDSYFNQLMQSPFVEAFNHWDDWQYNKTIYSSRKRYNWNQLKREFDAVVVLQEADIVMALFTAPMLYDFMFGFAQTSQELLEKGYFNEEEAIGIVEEMILADSLWYDNVEKKAVELGISDEECLNLSARYWLSLQKNKIKKQIRR